MSDNSIIEIYDDANKIEIEVDKIDFDKIEVDKNDDDKIYKIFTFDYEPHNGKPITRIEISPNENYLITYSNEDRSIIGWNVEDIDKVQLKFHQIVKINEDNKDKKYKIESLCVSDDKKLAYITRITTIDHYKIYREYTITVIDMNNDKNIALSFGKGVKVKYCIFNSKNEFVLYSSVHTNSKYHSIIWIYSTQTKNDKWECKRFYRIPEGYGLISISKYDKVYLNSNDYIYEWDINIERSVKIFGNNENKFGTYNIGIFSNEKFIFLKIKDKIIVYSIELKIPIASLEINNDIQLYNFMNRTGLFLLPSLFYYTPDKEIKYCWNNKYKNRNRFKPTDEPTDKKTKFVFGILNGRVWKSKFDEKMSKTNFSSENSDGLNNENNNIGEYLNVNSFNLYVDTVSTLFQKVITNVDYNIKKSTKLTGNLIKWEIYLDDSKIELSFFKKINIKWKCINMRVEMSTYFYNHGLIVSSLFNNDIVILTTFGILIFTFSENNGISLNYFYSMKLKNYGNSKEYIKTLKHYKSIFSKSTLPSPNYDSFRLPMWVSDLRNNMSSLLKYDAELLTFAIKEHEGFNE
ncbi:hypothetical protein RirG_078940 [Rhizophagus irregularis DAOM 197198w]|uniref:Uncharacterized protein n=1 Tax=Rhizophagus irregularis (strain DAOM 197198w) TaxID=1432141 RepID=A0A015JVM1_RHIIW|nr:hypothetical protein RirG_078940 [Rhizophagus irregularis DAOM 197198w]